MKTLFKMIMVIVHYFYRFSGLSQIETISLCLVWEFTKKPDLCRIGIYNLGHALHPETNELSGRITFNGRSSAAEGTQS